MRTDAQAGFSLVLGGPLYQLWRRTGLAGDELGLLRRRILVLTAVAWLPLLVLSVAAGTAWNDAGALPFLDDIGVQTRLLIAMPLLILAEVLVHRRLRPVVLQFTQRALVPDSARSRFDEALDSAMRLRNAVWAEAGIVALVYVVSVGFLWRTPITLDVASWHDRVAGGASTRSPAGWWLDCVSLPLFQVLLLRWYFRLFIWARFLYQVSRIKLALMPVHPDRCGGLGFLTGSAYAFVPLMLAHGAVSAGLIANRILHTGARLPEFKFELVGLAAAMVLAVLGPLLPFSRQLERARRAGLGAYGVLAQRYTREFADKWLGGREAAGEPLLGTADIQSLADLGASYDLVARMRWVPFTARTVVDLSVFTLLPALPLTLTMISVEDLLIQLRKIIF